MIGSYDDLIADVQAEVTDALTARRAADEQAHLPALTGADERAFVRDVLARSLQRYATQAVRDGRPPLTPVEEDAIVQAVMDGRYGLAGFQRWLDDPEVENINANGADVVFVSRVDARSEAVEAVAASDDDLIKLVRTAAARLGASERRFDAASPRVLLQLPDGSRLTAVMSVSHRPCVAIRRHRHLDATLADLHSFGMIDAELESFLTAAVLARKNIMVAGATGAGKTTLVSALCHAIPSAERIVTIEETRELWLQRWHPNVVSLEAREPNIEGAGGITLEMLYRWSLTLDPTRTIVGEVKGAEVLPMLSAMSQGNDGSLSTIHARSSMAVFSKLAVYALQSADRLPMRDTHFLTSQALDFIVFVHRDREGRRVVSSIREIRGFDGDSVSSNEVYRPGPEGMAVRGDPVSAPRLEELRHHGLGPAAGRVVEGPWA